MNNSIPDYKDIVELIRLVEQTTSHDKDFIEERFLEISPNFKSTLDFAGTLELVKTNSERISASYPQGVKSYSSEDNIRSALITSLKGHLLEIPILDHFLNSFENVYGEYVFQPTTQEALFFSMARNLCIHLSIVTVDKQTNIYRLTTQGMTMLKSMIQEKELNLQELHHLLERKSKLGAKAEEVVLKYEQKRLHNKPTLLSKVSQISVNNVSAGYDIESFELNGDSRKIEVKAVTASNLLFHWSKNEIKVAKKYKDSYYLYFVAGAFSNSPEIKIFNDPYKEVMLSKHWTKEADSYIITKTTN